MALEIEIARYNELLPKLLQSSEGKIAVIKDRDFLGTFDNYDQAYEVLLPKYGFVPSLMRRVAARKPVLDLRNLHLGLICVRR